MKSDSHKYKVELLKSAASEVYDACRRVLSYMKVSIYESSPFVKLTIHDKTVLSKLEKFGRSDVNLISQEEILGLLHKKSLLNNVSFSSRNSDWTFDIPRLTLQPSFDFSYSKGELTVSVHMPVSAASPFGFQYPTAPTERIQSILSEFQACGLIEPTDLPGSIREVFVKARRRDLHPNPDTHAKIDNHSELGCGALSFDEMNKVWYPTRFFLTVKTQNLDKMLRARQILQSLEHFAGDKGELSVNMPFKLLQKIAEELSIPFEMDWWPDFLNSEVYDIESEEMQLLIKLFLAEKTNSLRVEWLPSFGRGPGPDGSLYQSLILTINENVNGKNLPQNVEVIVQLQFDDHREFGQLERDINLVYDKRFFAQEALKIEMTCGLKLVALPQKLVSKL